jgi:hypothetical protein
MYEDLSLTIQSTEENQTYSPNKYKLPRVKISNVIYNHYLDQASPVTTIVPHLDYLKYSEYHQFSKSNLKKQRLKSETPKFTQLYRPQILQLSPRSRMKIYSCLPVVRESSSDKTNHKDHKQKKTIVFNTQPKVLPLAPQKIKPVERDYRPALTYGEKLWKLHEIASLDLDTQGSKLFVASRH